MEVSDVGIRFLEKEEGGAALTPYKDQADPPLWTIGVGHLIGPGERALMKGITREQALSIFRDDLRRFNAAVGELAKGYQPLHDMLVSLAFNCGAECLKPYKLLGGFLRLGAWEALFNEWLTYQNAGKAKGVLRPRRERELRYVMQAACGTNPDGFGGPKTTAAFKKAGVSFDAKGFARCMKSALSGTPMP